MIQVKDLQFPRYFLLNEIDIPSELVPQLLEIEVEVRNDGEPDTAQFKNNRLLISQPSSLPRFLFTVLYSIIKNHVKDGYFQDKLSLSLLFACRDYTYADYESHNHRPVSPPVLMDFSKLTVPHVIVTDIIEPLVGKMASLPVMFVKSNFVDAVEISENNEKFSKRFKYPFRSVSFHEYPLLVANSALHNEGALYAHLIYKLVEFSTSESSAQKVIKNIILSKDSSIIQHLVDVAKLLNGDPIFVMDFLKFFKSNVTLSNEEESVACEVRNEVIAEDKYLSKHIKLAQNYTPQVFKQWHQWSMLQGLIEKQLAPMRGSMWPTSENVKPIEDEHRQMAVERAKKKGKTQLNFEELLELAREWYGHKTVQPGQLAERLLRENRVWKT